MSPTSYQTAPSRDISGGERGIRTPAPFPTSRFSRPVPSTAWVFLRVVPEAGLEPARDLTPRRILSPVRLPISPLRQQQIVLYKQNIFIINIFLNNFHKKVNIFLFFFIFLIYFMQKWSKL